MTKEQFLNVASLWPVWLKHFEVKMCQLLQRLSLLLANVNLASPFVLVSPAEGSLSWAGT